MLLGNTLKRLRTISNLTASEMASKLDLSVSYISELENDKKTVSLGIIEQYAEVFNLQVIDIICLHDYFKQEPNVLQQMAHNIRRNY